jgi:hypothetical protein
MDSKDTFDVRKYPEVYVPIMEKGGILIMHNGDQLHICSNSGHNSYDVIWIPYLLSYQYDTEDCIYIWDNVDKVGYESNKHVCGGMPLPDLDKWDNKKTFIQSFLAEKYGPNQPLHGSGHR